MEMKVTILTFLVLRPSNLIVINGDPLLSIDGVELSLMYS